MSAEVAVREDVAALEQLDSAAREVAVTHALTDARNRLAFALQATGPETVAAIKAEVGAIADLSKRVGLSKEIRDDAIEVLRRAEYALGKAIRTGQERGEVRKRGERPGTFNRWNGETVDNGNSTKPSPTDFASADELTSRAGIYALVDGVAEPDFERALGEARAEGDVSRANVVRKIKGEQPKPSGERHELLKRTRRVDSNLIVAGTVEAAAVPASTLELVNYADLDRDNLGEWISSLSESIRTLRALRSRLEKELHREQV